MQKIVKIVVASMSLVTLLLPLSAFAKDAAPQDRVMLVFVFEKSCRISCDRVRPVLVELETAYKEKLRVVELDVSPSKHAETQKKAEELGLKSFLSDTEDWYPAVGIFSRNGKKVKEILGAQTKEKYEAAIEKALAAK